MDALLEALHGKHTRPPKEKFWFWIDEDRPAPMMREVQLAVAEEFGVDLKEVLSESRRKAVAIPRHAGMYLCRRLTKHGFARIGAKFNRDHSTVITAVERMNQRIRSDAALAARISKLEARFLA